MQEKLFSSAMRLPCGAVIPNRIAKAAMTEGLADPYNRATAQHATLYKIWSKGGAGLLISGNIQVDRRYLERPGNIAIDQNGGEDELNKMVQAGTINGNHFWAQLSHAGRQSSPALSYQPVAPSAVALQVSPVVKYKKPRALSHEEIIKVIDRFCHAARVVKSVGFTGIQIHAAHGYLLSQFLSPLTNQRTDEWGGTLAKRARLLLTIIQKIRAVVGRTYPIAIKLNSADFQKGGFSKESSRQVVQWAVEAGVDLIEISGGNYESMQFFGENKGQNSTTQKREAYFLEYANTLKNEIDIPLMVTGGFRTPAVMREALSTGALELLGLARPLLLNPNIPLDLLMGSDLALPSPEKDLKLGNGWLGPKSRFPFFKKLNTLGMGAWFDWQLRQLAINQKPVMELSLFKAIRIYQQREERMAKALVASKSA